MNWQLESQLSYLYCIHWKAHTVLTAVDMELLVKEGYLQQRSVTINWHSMPAICQSVFWTQDGLAATSGAKYVEAGYYILYTDI